MVSFTWANFTKAMMPELKVEISGAACQGPGGWWGRGGEGWGQRGVGRSYCRAPCLRCCYQSVSSERGHVGPRSQSNWWGPGNSRPWGQAKTCGLQPVNSCPEHQTSVVQDSKFQTEQRPEGEWQGSPWGVPWEAPCTGREQASPRPQGILSDVSRSPEVTCGSVACSPETFMEIQKRGFRRR